MRVNRELPNRETMDKDPFALNLDCIHCGLCLPRCPTYQLLGSEADSPRGRIYLMKAARQGRVEWDAQAVGHLDACLACRACESACPSGVRYEWMLAEARTDIRRRYPGGLLRRAAFRHLLPYPGRIRKAAGLMRVCQRLGLLRFASRSGLLRRLNPDLAAMQGKLPELPPSWRPAALYPAQGQRRYRVGLLTGCVMPVLFPQTHRATIEVLRLSGCEVVIPRRQPCCGALHWHDGRTSQALQLARSTCRTFQGEQLDAVIVNSAGCGAAMKEYGHWLRDDEPWQAPAAALSGKVEDVCEFLARIEPTWKQQPLPLRIAYDDACHLLHGQSVRDQPRRLLKSVPGLTLLDVPHSDRCCGAAGIYNLLQPQLSSSLTDWKVREILATRPDRVATGNPGCMMQLQAGLRAAGAELRVQHPLEILWESLRDGGAL